MNKTLLMLNRSKKLPDHLYERLRCTSGTTPRMYGLPKIHKPDIPMRPIVSFYTSPTYQLSRYLSDILSPLVGKTPSYVKDSTDFVSFIKDVKLEDEVMVSFDVKSLFTNVPTDLALDVANRYLLADDDLVERTPLSVDEILLLLKLCLDATFIQFWGRYFQQIHGTAMGSPVSVVVANMVMEHVEKQALESYPGKKPVFWKRYVDDVITVLDAKVIDGFHSHLNSIASSIQFTFELEEDGRLPFLDVLISRDDEGYISTSVYRKKTHTNQYLNFTSHHPTCHKTAVVSTLLKRAERLSSSTVHQATEEGTIMDALLKNGYPRKMIEKYRNMQNSTRSAVPEDRKPEPPTIMILPYVRGLSDSIKRIMRTNLGIKTIFTPVRSIRNILSHPKDPLLLSERSGVIYRIPCSDCPMSYVGQTKRNLYQRLQEHRRAVVTGDTASSALSEHCWSEHHRVNWDDTSILSQHQFWYQRSMLESWFIHSEKNLVNREKGPLPIEYRQLMKTTPTPAPPAQTPHARLS